MFKKIFSYIQENLLEEIHNLPLFIPVFIGIGIGFYFHLENEPKTWISYSIFFITLISLFFVNLGNSSDKFKHYKVIVAFSTLKYILRKFFKILLFTLLFPIIGHITLVILIGGWFVSLFEYSYYLRYLAFFYDNTLMKGIIRGIKFLFSPISKRIKKMKISSYSKNVIKTSKSKKNIGKNEFKLLVRTTKSMVGFIDKLLKKFLRNPLFMGIIFLRNLITKNVKGSFNNILSVLKKYIPENVLNNIWKVIYFANFILFFTVLGFFVIKLKTNLLDTKLLQTKLKNQKIIARVISSEDFKNDYRLTLDNVNLLNDKNIKLDKIRVRFSKEFGLPYMGKTIEFESSLIPPFEPDSVGGFNFARYSYFKKLSASGRSFT
ncbi:MAG: hypothetical protein IJ638_02180, partial [Alphaproteobacteria bacterium]|nr:hypothetical protein [Alphaproteobacteria bacterium]